MRGKLAAMSFGSLLALGSGCASSHHARYESPAPPQVVVPGPARGAVVVPAPRHGPVVPALTENEAAEIARAEAYRHGWRNVAVEQAGYWRDRWHVDIVHRAPNRGDRHGWVEVAPDGTVLSFAEGSHQHAGYRGRR